MSGETARLRLSDDRWVEFVASHPDAVAFHHPAWAQGLAETYGLRGFVLARREGGPCHRGDSLPGDAQAARWRSLGEPAVQRRLCPAGEWARSRSAPGGPGRGRTRGRCQEPGIAREDRRRGIWPASGSRTARPPASTTILTSSCVGFTHRRCAPISAARSADRSRFAALRTCAISRSTSTASIREPGGGKGSPSSRGGSSRCYGGG